MGWSIGYDSNWDRDIGYGVPAICDYPKCNEEIDRGLGFVCGGEPYGGDCGCGLYFCSKHLKYYKENEDGRLRLVCQRCFFDKKSFKPKPDTKEWLNHKMKDDSWEEWRKNNPDEVKKINKTLYGHPHKLPPKV